MSTPCSAGPPAPDTIVADAFRAWPKLTAVFVRRRMACPGCDLAALVTLREAAEAYGLRDDFFDELRRSAGAADAA